MPPRARIAGRTGRLRSGMNYRPIASGVLSARTGTPTSTTPSFGSVTDACVHEEVPNLSVQQLWSLHAAHVTDAGHDNEARAGDSDLKTLSDVERGTIVGVAEEQQRRKVDVAEHVGPVRLC